MEIINVIVSTKQNPVVSIDSFAVTTPSLLSEVCRGAEKLYKEKALENGFNKEDIEDSLDDGYIDDGLITIVLVHSYTQEIV